MPKPPVLKSVMPMPSMLKPRQHHGFVYAKGNLYAIGGLDLQGKPIQECESFNLSESTKAWQSINSLNAAYQKGFCVCVYQQNHIFVIGNDSQGQLQAELYYVGLNQWTKAKIMNECSFVYQEGFSASQVNSESLLLTRASSKKIESYLLTVQKINDYKIVIRANPVG